MRHYQDYYEQVMTYIEKKGIGVLATADKNVPSTRMVSFVVYDGKLAFQTSCQLSKYQEIAQNAQVAVNFTAINIQGRAVIQADQVMTHEKFVTLFQEKHLDSFETYSHMSSNRVVEVIPEQIVIWEYEAGEPYRVFLDIVKQTVERVHYDHSIND